MKLPPRGPDSRPLNEHLAPQLLTAGPKVPGQKRVHHRDRGLPCRPIWHGPSATHFGA